MGPNEPERLAVDGSMGIGDDCDHGQKVQKSCDLVAGVAQDPKLAHFQLDPLHAAVKMMNLDHNPPLGNVPH